MKKAVIVFLIALGISSAHAQHKDYQNIYLTKSWQGWNVSPVNGTGIFSHIEVGSDSIIVRFNQHIAEDQYSYISGNAPVGRHDITQYSDGLKITFYKRDEFDRVLVADPVEMPDQVIAFRVTLPYDTRTCTPSYYHYNYNTEQCELDKCPQEGTPPNCHSFTCPQEGTWPNCHNYPREGRNSP